MDTIKKLIFKRRMEEEKLEGEAKAVWEERKRKLQKVEDAKKEDQKKQSTPEECREEIQRIETKLEELQEQKHRYFVQLKNVLKEDEKAKEAERKKQEERRLSEAAQQEAETTKQQEASPVSHNEGGFRPSSLSRSAMLLGGSSNLLRPNSTTLGIGLVAPVSAASVLPNPVPLFPPAQAYFNPAAGAPFVHNQGTPPGTLSQQRAMSSSLMRAPSSPASFPGIQYPHQTMVPQYHTAQIMHHSSSMMGIPVSRPPFNPLQHPLQRAGNALHWH